MNSISIVSRSTDSISLIDKITRRVLVILCIVCAFLIFIPNMLPANVLVNPPYTVDDRIIIEVAWNLTDDAQQNNVVSDVNAQSVMLADKAVSGSLVLAPVETRFPFNEALPSWNGTAPEGTGFSIRMRVRMERDWSPWFLAGTWGTHDTKYPERNATFQGGKYGLDTLLLEHPADAVQYKLHLERTHTSQSSPRVWRLALAYSNSLQDKELWQRYGDTRPVVPAALRDIATTESLAIPFCTQVVERKEWIGSICSPASVAMAISYFKDRVPTREVAAAIYDPVAEMFGIWHRAVQAAAEYGVQGYIGRFRTWGAVREQIKSGSVLCASIRFEHGTLDEPPRIYKDRGTTGHLIVIRGFAPGGRVITNDSASSRYGERLTWLPEDLAKAWFDKGGVAYVFTSTVIVPRD